VIDGDTIEIHGTRVRLFGIDAPEHDQLCSDRYGARYRCGQVASNALAGFIGRQAVACVEVDRDRYRRTVAVCSVGQVDLADWLVRAGLAIDWPRYSKGDYAPTEAGRALTKSACGADNLSNRGAIANASALAAALTRALKKASASGAEARD
jgi:endonuclease YncB( thermonuclease family)